MTHALFSTQDVTYRNKPAYGQGPAMNLALSSPESARENADNYAMYALAAYWPNGRWSNNPNNLVQGGDEL
jgi:hypothetical protein